MLTKYDIKTLSNGLRVVTVPMDSTESVAAILVIGAGTRFEDKGNNGISHFLEHIAFKGTKKFKDALSLSSTVDSVGAEFNAFTDKEYTGFYVKAAKKHLKLALEVLSELVFNPLIKRTDIEKEKGVIVEEINMCNDQPMAKVSNDFEALLYKNTPLGYETVGTKENIKGMTQKDFLTYRKRYYVPENIVLGIAGAMPKTGDKRFKIKSLVGKYFGSQDPARLNLGVRQGSTLLTFLQKEPAVFVRHKKTAQSHFCLGTRTFKRTHKDRYALSVLAAILGGGMSSRLFTEVREKRGLAYYVHTTVEAFHDNGYLVTQAGVDTSKAGEAIKVILGEYKKVAQVGKLGKELEKAKEYLRGRFILSLENSKSVASLFAESMLLEGRSRTPEQILRKVDKVTAKDILRVAGKIFREGNLSLSLIGPHKNESRFEKLLRF